MFNLSNDFIIKKEVNKSIKEEFRLKFKNKNISFIDSFNLKELMNLLNNSDIKKKDIVLIIKYLCFLNDKEVILFPLFFDKYPKINTSYCLNIMNEGIPKNYIDEHKIIHKNDNFRFGQIFRSYDGNIDFLSKEEYEKVYQKINNTSHKIRYEVHYRQFLDTLYYLSCKNKGSLDVEFVINRFRAGGKWYSYDWLKDFEGMEYYQEEVEYFLVNYDKCPKACKSSLNILMRYFISLDYKPKFDEINRNEHIFDPSRKNQTLTDFINEYATSNKMRNGVINYGYKFFEYLKSKKLMDINPIYPKEDYKQKEKIIKKLGTHRKALNQELVENAKKLILENDMEFVKNCNMNFYSAKLYNYKTKDYDNNVFTPSVALALYTLLEVPIRGLQLQLLDSGEGDEYRYCFQKKKVIKNNHPYAEKGRNVNFIRKAGYEDFDGEYYSLWITTNKAITDGYEIPYLSEELYEVLKRQYDFIETYDPMPEKVNQSEIARISLSKEYPKFYPLFRDLSSRKKTIIDRRKIQYFWACVCQELENRYKKKGIDITLTKEAYNGIRAKFDLHSLRVTGITNLLERGVPLNLVSRYIAGHSSFAMTLWYNNPSPKTLREHMESARNKVLNNGNNDFENLTPSEMESNFIGGSHKYISDNSGMLSIGLSGICPFKQCEIGGEEIGKNKYKPVPQGANGYNCFSCRFFITGPKFIMGQMIEGNLLIREIQKKVQFLDKIKEDIMDCEDDGNIQKMNVLKGQKEIEEDKYRNMLHEWWSRVKTFEASRKMIEKDNKNLVVLGDDTKLALKEMNSFELLHNITTMGEFFPEFTNFTESFNEIENIMNKFLMKNDINPFILNLEEKEKIKACNLMGDMLLEISEQYKVEDLLEGKVLLKDIPELSGRITKLLDYRRK